MNMHCQKVKNLSRPKMALPVFIMFIYSFLDIKTTKNISTPSGQDASPYGRLIPSSHWYPFLILGGEKQL